MLAYTGYVSIPTSCSNYGQTPTIHGIGLDKSNLLLVTAQHRADTEGLMNALFSVQDVRTLDPHRFPCTSYAHTGLVLSAHASPAQSPWWHGALDRDEVSLE
jgi:hypothetical protein